MTPATNCCWDGADRQNRHSLLKREPRSKLLAQHYIYIMLTCPGVNQCYIYILSIHIFIAIEALFLLELNCITVTYCPRRLFILVKWALRL